MYTQRSYAIAVLLLGAFLGGCASAAPYQGLDSDQLFELGAQEFEDGDWDEVVRVFERFIFADPTNARMVEARLYLARAYFNREDYLTAVSEFTRIIDRHPGDRLAPEAALGICQSYAALSPHIERDQAYTVQAFNACDNVVQDFGGFESSLEAEDLREQMREKLAEKELTRGNFYFQRKMYDSGIIYFNGVLTQYPGTETGAKALLRLYQSYTEIGWEAEAEDAKERLLREFPDSESAREVRANGGGE
jgi:outer membrane protein assembly factor BamD